MADLLPLFPLNMVAFPGMTRAAARLRGALPGAGAPPARRSPTRPTGCSGSSRSGRATRSAATRPGRCTAPAASMQLDRGRGVRRRPLRRRRASAGTGCGSWPPTPASRSSGPRSSTSTVDPRSRASTPRGRRRTPWPPSATTATAVSRLRGDDVMTGAAAARPRDALLRARRDLLADAARAPAAAGVADARPERLGLLRRLMRRELRAMAAIPSLPGDRGRPVRLEPQLTARLHPSPPSRRIRHLPESRSRERQLESSTSATRRIGEDATTRRRIARGRDDSAWDVSRWTAAPAVHGVPVLPAGDPEAVERLDVLAQLGVRVVPAAR